MKWTLPLFYNNNKNYGKTINNDLYIFHGNSSSIIYTAMASVYKSQGFEDKNTYMVNIKNRFIKYDKKVYNQSLAIETILFI